MLTSSRLAEGLLCSLSDMVGAEAVGKANGQMDGWSCRLLALGKVGGLGGLVGGW